MGLALGCLLGALLTGCGDGVEPGETPLPDPLTYDVAESGPFGVGYRAVDVTYDSPAGPRDIVLNIWYPSEAPAGESPRYAGLFEDAASFVDAPVARPAYSGTFPVLVHSHGHQGFGGNSAAIMRHMASHGWVAVAPDHTDNLLGNSDPRPTRHFYERPLDIRAALDTLAALPSDDALAALDVSRVAMTGHSFGTYTTWVSAGAAFDLVALQAACEADELPDTCTPSDVAVFEETDLSEPRVVVAMPMAGGERASFFGDTGYDAASVPMMLMTGSEDDVGAAALFDKVSDELELSWIDVAGGCHQLFGLGGCADVSDDVGFPIVNAYVLANARRFVLDDDRADVVGVTDGTAEVSPLVTFQSK